MNTIVQRHQGTVTITLPIRTVSEANAHEFWRTRQRRAKSQRIAAEMTCTVPLGRFHADLDGSIRPLSIHMTRIAPSAGLDSDNLPSSMKHCRDGVADALGIDDRDKRVTWTYAQERGGKGEYAVRIEVRQRAEVNLAGFDARKAFYEALASK